MGAGRDLYYKETEELLEEMEQKFQFDHITIIIFFISDRGQIRRKNRQKKVLARTSCNIQ